jgi:pyruvate/oxaloacetate carboxyltransferase
MRNEQIEEVLPLLLDAHYFGLEVWGGATLDSCMRFLNTDPWKRLERITEITDKRTHLTALARGINLFGYNPYPDEVVYQFNKLAVESGITIMRIFDALNDLNNLKVTIKAVKESGGMADCAICYTTNPTHTTGEKFKHLLKKGSFPKDIYNVDYFVEKAVTIEEMGADIITIKDMAGLIDPKMAYHFIKKVKQKVNVPVNLHSHCTPGYALTCHIAAMVAGVDILDVVSYPFSGGPSHPAVEIVCEFASKMGIETDVNKEVFPEIRKKLEKIRMELAPFDNYKDMRFEFNGEFTDHQHELMEEAIKCVKTEDFDRATSTVHKLEASLNLPAPNEPVRLAQIPGGMYSNMVTQLKELNISDLFDDVLKEVPRVRVNAGTVPLVTPTSQIVGVQAVKNVLLKNQGEEEYSSCTDQYIKLVRGEYGQTPAPINPVFREKITGSSEEKRFDTSTWKHTEAPEGHVMDIKDQMLLDLFPAVALKFLQQREDSSMRIHTETQKNLEYERLATAVAGNYLE